ncbi:ABC transporter ATP-binding protein [Veronia pacifica]|uniref:ABC transporter ATP-binding protein n=1 Tax=Veronia pacifica TaxID=1080227 RepID=A0A1C3ES01_9GAMM|nr:ABC transporter ATP-binding protein [Veronia pacifica]ODA36039.1 ABC transporter ATP-binding protein [Veronia pacifica]
MSGQIELTNLGQSFCMNGANVNLFEGLNLTIHQGQSYAITGPSGAGKSSLLMLVSGLESPSSGQVNYVSGGQTRSLDSIRESVGFIFQQFHLLPELTALNNVALPLKLRGDKQAIEKAKTWLNKVGLGHRLNHKPQQMSGGEQQRVAIARALVFEPKFIFADEPTGNLDQKSATDIADLLFACCREHGAGLVVVTHSNTLARRASHQFMLSDGRCDAVSHSYVEEVSA